MLKQIIHNRDDASAIKILKNIRAAMKPDAKFMLVETVIPELEHRNPLERTGLRLMHIVSARSPFVIMEAVRV